MLSTLMKQVMAESHKQSMLLLSDATARCSSGLIAADVLLQANTSRYEAMLSEIMNTVDL